jgi:hypothetical protein
VDRLLEPEHKRCQSNRMTRVLVIDGHAAAQFVPRATNVSPFVLVVVNASSQEDMVHIAGPRLVAAWEAFQARSQAPT